MISISKENGKTSYLFNGTNDEQRTETAIALASYMNSTYEGTGSLPEVIRELDDVLITAASVFCKSQNVSFTELLSVMTIINNPDVGNSILSGGFLS